MKKKVITLLLACSSAFAFSIGPLTLDTEFGGSVNYASLKITTEDQGNVKNDKHLGYGAYGRVWLGFLGFMIAPQVKWDYLSTNIPPSNYKPKFHNMQYGALLGYRIPLVDITPYLGVSYSDFIKQDFGIQKLKSTYAINFGINWKLPLLPLAIGIDGSYQTPKFQDNVNGLKNARILTISGTLGFIF